MSTEFKDDIRLIAVMPRAIHPQSLHCPETGHYDVCAQKNGINRIDLLFF